MNKILKKIVLVNVTIITMIFSSCEKEIIETKSNELSPTGQTHFVSIDDVPFLFPSIEKFNADYKFLSNPSLKGRGGVQDLNLELSKIVEYAADNGCDSYSIPIKNELDLQQEYYFENLNVIKLGDQFQPFITRFTSTNQEKFSLTTFSGKIEILDLNKILITTLPFESGQLKIPPVFVPRDFENDPSTGGGAGTSGNGGGPGGFVTWVLNQLGYTVLWSSLNNSWQIVRTITTINTNSSGINPNDGTPNLGYISLFPNGTQTWSTPNSSTPNTNSGSSGSFTFVPNPPTWVEDNTLVDQVNLIIQRLQPSANASRWLKNTINSQFAQEIYSYLYQNPNINNSDTFVKNALERMMANPEVYKSIKPFIIEKQIIDIDLDPCAKNVLTQLKNTTVCDIAQVLAKLDANAEVYNTTIKTETLPNGNTSPATTKWNSPFNYTIYISPNYTGKTKLFRASLILHEMVHAYFLSLKDDYFYSNPPNLNSLSDFTNLFHYYVTLKYPLSLNSYDFHHQQMATDYVDAIARALQEYQTGIPVPNASQPNQVYNDLAWFGLVDTPVFDNMFPIGNPNLQRILNRGAAEQTGNAINAGTPNAQVPIGNPCN